MQLYHILKDRAAINILKVLYDNEKSATNTYTLGYSELKKRIIFDPEHSCIKALEKCKLISCDKSDETNWIFSMTKKGSGFIEKFDALKNSFYEKKNEKKAFSVEYNLTNIEKKILVLCAKINSETGKDISLKTLTQEVYPYTEPTKNKARVSKNIKKLEEINLLTRSKKGSQVFFRITDSGRRVAKEQLESMVFA